MMETYNLSWRDIIILQINVLGILIACWFVYRTIKRFILSLSMSSKLNKLKLFRNISLILSVSTFVQIIVGVLYVVSDQKVVHYLDVLFTITYTIPLVILDSVLSYNFDKLICKNNILINSYDFSLKE